MKDFFKYGFLTVVCTVLFAGFIYLVYALFLPMRVVDKAVDREIVENSQQYVETQRDALVKFNTQLSFIEGSDEIASTQRKAIKQQMCVIANKIPREEIPISVKSNLTGCI